MTIPQTKASKMDKLRTRVGHHTTCAVGHAGGAPRCENCLTSTIGNPTGVEIASGAANFVDSRPWAQSEHCSWLPVVIFRPAGSVNPGHLRSSDDQAAGCDLRGQVS